MNSSITTKKCTQMVSKMDLQLSRTKLSKIKTALGRQTMRKRWRMRALKIMQRILTKARVMLQVAMKSVKSDLIVKLVPFLII